MTNEQLFLLEIMKAAGQGTHITQLPEAPLNWTQLWKEACDQTVRILFYDALSPVQDQLALCFPEYEEGMLQIISLLGKNMLVERAQEELVGELNQLNLPYVILKGQAAANYYPDPSLRQMGDVDFLVATEHTGAIAARMQEKGYQHSWEKDDYHQVLKKDSVVMEMHMEVAGMPSGEGRKFIEAYMQDIYQEAQSCASLSGTFVAPSHKHHAMVLILHMLHHVEDYGLGLRHLMDWACFVDRTANEPFWPELLTVLKQSGLHYFTAVMTKMSSIYLGSHCPDWAQVAQDSLCADMMEDIMNGGNFGRRDSNRARSVSMLPDWEDGDPKEGKVKRMFAMLRRSLIHQKPELEHKPVSLFFHIVYKTGRFAVLYIQGKRPNLIKAAAIADERASVYEQLQLYKAEN